MSYVSGNLLSHMILEQKNMNELRTLVLNIQT